MPKTPYGTVTGRMVCPGPPFPYQIPKGQPSIVDLPPVDWTLIEERVKDLYARVDTET